VLHAACPPATGDRFDVPAMTAPHDVDYQPVGEHVIDDAVVTDPHPVGPCFTGEGDTAWWPGVIGEQVDRGSHPLLLLARKRGEGFDCTPGDLDPVALAPGRDRL
jgi:hypothetical protein